MNTADIINHKPVEFDQSITEMITPTYDDFINNPFRRLDDIYFWSPLIQLNIMINDVLSFEPISYIREWWIVKSNNSKNKKEKEKKIRLLVRSHRLAFQRFNDSRISSRAELTPDGETTIRGFIHSKTNRNIHLKRTPTST